MPDSESEPATPLPSPSSSSETKEDHMARQAYVEALRRIQEWKADGGDGLNFMDLGLRDLPPEIGQLSALKVLALHNNSLQQLPPEIGQLSALKYLYLQDNALQQLPPEIGQLSALESLYLRGNPGLGLPPEVVKDRFNPRAILDYYFSKVAASARPLNEVKLL
ncbi:MAG: Leucine-rich repeat (LRR) protein, partial [Verrucomicrobiales bacterium]